MVKNKFRWMNIILVLFQVLCCLTTNIDGDLPENSISKAPPTEPVDVLSTSTPTAAPSNKTERPKDKLVSPSLLDPSKVCPTGTACSVLGGDCIHCMFNASCVYGSVQTAVCSVREGVNCTGNQTFERSYHCRYCYQLDTWLYTCNASLCQINTPRKTWPARPFYTSLCTVRQEVLCMGRRRFYKQRLCNWTRGYKWSTAFILSLTLGGFGADRFYLGLWREGIGKLFSFGGLGVWTLVDAILIAVGYVGPADGSLYI
ncbi:TM2 domain-containing protein 3-like [Gigantopelta aegis]|uniref:TM2 domain-containing protein 3-like n=1 Tax=Gigantopelta aegis TaxID=1735272 RepID=UPI001B88D139|nr:TM2 domain-containing protein 3-like [Gigantopelta aegis]